MTSSEVSHLTPETEQNVALLMTYLHGLLRQELLDLPWPDAVLNWKSATEVAGAEGRPMWRGVCVGIGIAWGGSTYRKPLNTGTRHSSRHR